MVIIWGCKEVKGLVGPLRYRQGIAVQTPKLGVQDMLKSNVYPHLCPVITINVSIDSSCEVCFVLYYLIANMQFLVSLLASIFEILCLFLVKFKYRHVTRY